MATGGRVPVESWFPPRGFGAGNKLECVKFRVAHDESQFDGLTFQNQYVALSIPGDQMVDGVATYLVAIFFGETRDGSVRGVKPFSPLTPTSLRKKRYLAF